MVSNKKQKEAIENAKLDRKSALKVASKTYKEDTELEEGLKQARKNVGMDPDKPSCCCLLYPSPRPRDRG